MPMNPLLGFIINKKFRWLRHALFILIGLVLAFKGDFEVMERINASAAARRAILLMDGLLFLAVFVVFYIMILYTIPRLLFRSRFFLFFSIYLVMIIILYFISFGLEVWLLRPNLPYNPTFQYSTLSITDFIQKALVISVMQGAVVGLMVFKKWIVDVQRMNELKQANLKTELEQLKSQVNPHFLFNTLNNLHVLTKTDPDKASQVILGLSDLLRYQLYDSARDKILLTKDIAFINNLLSLEKIRKDDFDYEVRTEGNLEGISLPPFLFIPFVENAIKHGASTVGHSYLKLNFRITAKRLYFYAENSKPSVKSNLPEGGIGLKNINRRLELLYPENHRLEVQDEPTRYIINLTIPL